MLLLATGLAGLARAAWTRRRATMRKSPPSGVITLVAVLILLGASQGAVAGTLWLANDSAPLVFHTDTAGGVLGTVAGDLTTGIAFDGTNQYFSNFSSGSITKRTPDGLTVLDTFAIPKDAGVCCGEDMAWDSARSRLWRIDHSNGVNIPSFLRKINPVTHLEDVAFPMPLSFGEPAFTSLGGLGVAYDSKRDLLYASFCHAGCAGLSDGIVLTVNPNTGAVLGTLFTTSGFATGGLGYDPDTDTLWVGDSNVVRHMTLGGAVLSSFVGGGGGFHDGLEFIRAPEPGTLLLLGASIGLAAFGYGRRPRTRRPE